MDRISRRTALCGAVTGAVFGIATPVSPLLAAKSVRIPNGPMRLVRHLERGMRGGAVLSVEREWQVDFTKRGEGFAITGQQVAATVDAPEALAPLAQIEQSRSTARMFPIVLDANGFIAAAGPHTLARDLRAAVKQAEEVIAQREISSDAKALQMQYLAQLQRASSSFLKHLPSDLFFPVSKASRAVRPVNLPDGVVGEFEVTYEAIRAPSQQWLDRAERQVITRVGHSERRASEVWSMAPL